MKKIILILFTLVAIAGKGQICTYNPLAAYFNQYYLVNNVQALNITDTSATLSGTFTAGQNSNAPTNFCASNNHRVTLGFFYDTICSNIAMWSLSPNASQAPYFPPAGIHRIDSTLYLQAWEAAFPGSNGASFRFNISKLLPNKTYYIRWFVKDTSDNGTVRRLINAGNQTDSLITKKSVLKPGIPCALFKIASDLEFFSSNNLMITNVTDTSATLSARFTGGYNPSCQTDFNQSFHEPNQVTFGFLYDTACANLSMNYLNVPVGNAVGYDAPTQQIPAQLLFPPRSVSRLEKSILISDYRVVPLGDTLKVYSFNMHHLSPGKKYYIRWFVKDYGANWTQVSLGNTLDYFTARTPRIFNNTILSGNQALCQLDSGNKTAYFPKQIRASIPSGGLGMYTYNWQKSTDSAKTWQAGETASGKNNAQNYLPGPNTGSPSQVFYRRIVSSGSRRDTSQFIAITFISPSSSEQVSLFQQRSDSNKIVLAASLTPSLGALTVQWQDSTGKSFKALPSNAKNNLIIPASADTSHHYQALVSYGRGCPVYKSAVIGLSPPDGNGNRYATVKIGVQQWMMNNLRATKFNDGSSIQGIKKTEQWSSMNSPAYCWYNHDSVSNAVRFGALYNNYVVVQVTKNACPVGWHVATSGDWATLSTYIGGQTGATAGIVLKSADTWIAPNKAMNSYNFNAMPGGGITHNGGFTDKLSAGKWWAPGQNLTHYSLLNFSDKIHYLNTTGAPNAQKEGFSIRCMKNIPNAKQ